MILSMRSKTEQGRLHHSLFLRRSANHLPIIGPGIHCVTGGVGGEESVVPFDSAASFPEICVILNGLLR